MFFVLKDVPGHEGQYASLAQATAAGATTLNVGNFLNAFISFVIIALVVFILIRTINEVEAKLLKKEVGQLAKTKICPFCKCEVSKQATRCPHCTSFLDE